MITEDYVSFEIAKLLKEKGFDGDCQYCYIDENDLDKDRLEVPTGYDAEIDAPTLQMAMKWLRKEHNIHIKIDRASKYWYYTLRKIKAFGTVDMSYHVDFNTYEDACEAAIKYCLEKFI